MPADLVPLICFLGVIIWIIPGALAGLVTGFAFKSMLGVLDLRDALTIALGWGLGLTMGGTVGLLIGALTAGYVPSIVSFVMVLAIIGLVTSLIGGSITNAVLETRLNSESTTNHPFAT